MIHLIHGKDSYLVRNEYRRIRDELGAADDMLESNTTVLDGSSVTPEELLSHATAMPFLASHRLVVVEGLLRRLGQQRGGRRTKKAADDPLEPWRRAAALLGDSAAVPETTTLVFMEGEVDTRSAAFAIFAAVAQTVELNGIAKDELGDWIAAAAARKDVTLTPRALAALAQLVGPDLWTLDSELDKLAAYGGGEPVDERAVEALVSAAQETKIWDLTDAVVAGNERKALAALPRLLFEGEAPTFLAFMIARQYRQLALVKDMLERRMPGVEIIRASGVPQFKFNSVSALASRYGWPQLRTAYETLLAADLRVKRGLQDDESSLQLLVHELCALAPRGSGGRAGAYGRPPASRGTRG